MENDTWRHIVMRSWYDSDLKCVRFALTCSFCGSNVFEEEGSVVCHECGKIKCSKSSLLNVLHSQALLSEQAFKRTSFADEASLWLLRSMKLASRVWSNRPRFLRNRNV